MCKFYLNILNKQTVFKSVVSTILIHKGVCVIRFLKTLGMEKFLAELAVFMHDSSILSKIEYKKNQSAFSSTPSPKRAKSPLHGSFSHTDFNSSVRRTAVLNEQLAFAGIKQSFALSCIT